MHGKTASLVSVAGAPFLRSIAATRLLSFVVTVVRGGATQRAVDERHVPDWEGRDIVIVSRDRWLMLDAGSGRFLGMGRTHLRLDDLRCVR